MIERFLKLVSVSCGCYFLNLLIAQTIIAITRITRKIPTPIPAWKMSPTSSQLVTENKINKSPAILKV